MRGGVDYYALTNTSSQISHKPIGNENLTHCVNVGLPTELPELRTLYGINIKSDLYPHSPSPELLEIQHKMRII